MNELTVSCSYVQYHSICDAAADRATHTHRTTAPGDKTAQLNEPTRFIQFYCVLAIQLWHDQFDN